MIRRISTKWVLAVLVAVVVPFAGFAIFVNTKVASRLSDDVVRFHLLSMAANLADLIDSTIEERSRDIHNLAASPLIGWMIGAYLNAGEEDEQGSESSGWRVWLDFVPATFDRFVKESGIYDLVLAVDANGRVVAHSTLRHDGTQLMMDEVAALKRRDFSTDTWFLRAMKDGEARIDQHRSDLITSGLPSDSALPENYHIGFAGRIDDPDGQRVGALLLLMNWRFIQDEIESFGVRRLDEGGQPDGAVGEDIYKSSYAWIWKSDADTILAHPKRELYGKRVSQPPVELPQLVAGARTARWGMYPEYEFAGVRKRAAFKWCNGEAGGGFGWVVGIGVDNADIFGPVHELSRLLYSSSAVVLLVAVLLTVIVARRTTRPILELERHTRRIAHGDLDARIEVRSRDELGRLAESFNRMTEELKENREQLVKAEKDAAWREMARQVAHEIKNPLTPISLSASLLRRSYEERSPEFDGILTRTLDMIQRQVEAMREIARDFYTFAGEHKEPKVVDVEKIVDEVIELNGAWAADRGVRVTKTGTGEAVFGDPDELHRAFINLVSNAIEAMPDGGDLAIELKSDDAWVTVEIRDSGEGVSAEVRERLFEPYFTTRSSGTGLGLAIVRRVIEDMGGTVELGNAEGGAGAVARIRMRRHA